MDLPNPKELRALLKVCRDFGVETMEVGTMKLKLGEMPKAEGATKEADAIPSGPSEEELTYWSAQPDPLAARLEAQ
jgi:hypothetical protein